MMTEQLIHASIAPGAAMDRPVERPARPWWRRRALLVGLAIMLAGVMLWRLIPAAGSTDIAGADIETGEVTRAPFADYLPVRATVAPRVTTLVGVLAGGQVEKLIVQDGAMVTEGEPLATLANPSLKLDVLTREAQIASQLGGLAGENLGIERNRLDRAGQIAQANYDLIKARRDLGIRQLLHDKGFVSDAGVKSYAEEAVYQERRVAQLQAGGAAEARITAIQGRRLDDTRGRLERNLAAVRAGLDALIIRAPMAGRLTNFTIQPGQALKPGDPAGQVDSEGSWKLTADVDEYYLGRVRVGQRASAGGTALTVSKVLPAVKDGRFRIELTFDAAPPAGLNRGQTLDMRVTLGSTAPALVAPVGGWLEAGGGTSAFVLDADGAHARRRSVKTGRRNPEQVEILAGLQRGERIVTSNTSSVKGDILNIR
ncbi:efflux transporter, RND family, MFP subunit [Sphingomonas sp. S17]|mgnify:CR=1 FL=1|nr:MULTISPECIES: HlyD family efflux transporter periplasmic adaptor subunit [Sphingomonas]EGI55774.1 efflux transporter, RND family, MFP subunit [Sphingomonas sp. S17]MCM3679562.1 HlyD family efflux transporter periplasmic adaptor subunit [Sphingomonas paucimobilis]MDG5971043.1 HlyD family efflux transporter periplasmic adaptor subunit [Sphingomonas paucimobilis]SUJ06506.1 Macrolide-specific efflux protein macA precursor [Sphingomonas paucimobilis]